MILIKRLSVKMAVTSDGLSTDMKFRVHVGLGQSALQIRPG